LTTRRSQADFWSTADYVPLAVEGTYRNHIMAFARQNGATGYVTIVPLYLARLCRETGVTDPLAIDWQDTQVALPSGSAWRDCLSERTGDSFMVSNLFGDSLPLAFVELSR
jgi:(1->4)-alpha-D-glucan 1-alpha-D-glucosylmutase